MGILERFENKKRLNNGGFGVIERVLERWWNGELGEMWNE